MVGVRISTRTELKNNMVELYDAIEENNSFQALGFLQLVKKNAIVYYNTRGIDCSELYPLFSETLNLLRKNFLVHPGKRELTKKKLYEYLFNLNKALKSSAFTDGGETGKGHVVVRLREIADDLMDDYSEYNLGDMKRNQRILDLIKNDLMEIREMEPYVRSHVPEIMERYSMLVKSAYACLMILPYVKDTAVSAGISKKFREAFEVLFGLFTDIFLLAEIEEKQKEQEETVLEKTRNDRMGKPASAERKEPSEKEKKEESRPSKEPVTEEKTAEETGEETIDDDEMLIDLEELERKARERVVNDEENA